MIGYGSESCGVARLPVNPDGVGKTVFSIARESLHAVINGFKSACNEEDFRFVVADPLAVPEKPPGEKLQLFEKLLQEAPKRHFKLPLFGLGYYDADVLGKGLKKTPASALGALLGPAYWASYSETTLEALSNPYKDPDLVQLKTMRDALDLNLAPLNKVFDSKTGFGPGAEKVFIHPDSTYAQLAIDYRAKTGIDIEKAPTINPIPGRMNTAMCHNPNAKDSTTPMTLQSYINLLQKEDPQKAVRYQRILSVIKNPDHIENWLVVSESEIDASPELQGICRQHFLYQQMTNLRKEIDEEIKRQELPESSSEKDSTTPFFRKYFKDKGLSGIGRNVAIIEAEGDFKSGSHGDIVKQRIVSPHKYGGLVPDARVLSYEPKDRFIVGYSDSDSEIKDNEDSLRRFIGLHASSVLGGTCDGLKEIKVSGIKHDAINLSSSLYLKGFTDYCYKLLEMKSSDSKDFVYPELRKRIYGDQRELLTSDDKYQRVSEYARIELRNNQTFKNTLQEYKALTEEFWDKGTPVVVSAGNHNKSDKKNDKGIYEKDTLITNIHTYGKVISVGSVSTNGTPRNIKDDKLSDFSSMPGEYPILAPGGNIRVENKTVNGTSFAAPYVVSVIVLMKQRHPTMTSDEIYRALSASGVMIKQDDMRMLPVLNPAHAERAALMINRMKRLNTVQDFAKSAFQELEINKVYNTNLLQDFNGNRINEIFCDRKKDLFQVCISNGRRVYFHQDGSLYTHDPDNQQALSYTPEQLEEAKGALRRCLEGICGYR